jgi:hypothetical protein
VTTDNSSIRRRVLHACIDVHTTCVRTKFLRLSGFVFLVEFLPATAKLEHFHKQDRILALLIGLLSVEGGHVSS